MLEIHSEKANLSITLIGDGVIPSILCSVEGDVFNLGYIIAKETAISTFKVHLKQTATFRGGTVFLIFFKTASCPLETHTSAHSPEFLEVQNGGESKYGSA